MDTTSQTTYDAQQITVLKGLEAVRKRPAMYIGSTDTYGLHHLVYEAIDNAIDESLAGFCDTVWITINKDGSITVKDNGRGFPIGEHKDFPGKSALEVAMTNLHAGGKFEKGAYKVSAGLHGVGIKCTNALSKWMRTQVFKDGKIYEQSYERGKAVSKLEIVGKSKETGTAQTFMPDEEIFSTTEFNFNTLVKRARQQAFLVAKLRFILKDERPKPHRVHSLYFENGIKTYVRIINSGSNTLMEPMYLKDSSNDVMVEVAFQYRDSINTEILCFTNNILNADGGMHDVGFKTAITKAINDHGKKTGIFKSEKDVLTGDDVREGLTAIVSVKLHDPQFEGQTKLKLNNPEVKSAVYKVVREKLMEHLDENPKESRAILERALLAQKARVAAKAARDTIMRKTALAGMTLPGKLADCSETDPTKSELFIVEGDSAGGSAKQGRDRFTQAVFPLRGKPLNAEKAHLGAVLKNKEFEGLVTAVGTGIGENINLEKLRYHKLIIMTDADVDGAHIYTLVLTFFYRHMPELIEAGHVYLAQPPLYKIVDNKKNSYWVKDDEARIAVEQKIANNGAKVVSMQRFKGLGEMNADQLTETTMSAETRTLKRVSIDDAEEADRTFSTLMGDEVAPRKRFILEHAKFAELDV